MNHVSCGGRGASRARTYRALRALRVPLLAAALFLGVFASSAWASGGGNFIATGHDMDLHCVFGASAECQYLTIVVDKVRNGSSLPILALDQGNELPGALSRAGESPVVTVNPTSGAFSTMPFVDASGNPLYSAIITASDSSCGGCDNNSTGEAAINARASDFATFFNAGGGILALSAAGNFRTYYNFVPLNVAGTATSPPYTPTADGAAIGVTSTMANCCATHNSFSTPPAPLVVLEQDRNGGAETIAAFNATISTGGDGGGGGFTGGGTEEPLTVTGHAVSATEGQSFSGVVANVSGDSDSAASDYTASIAWGDGSTSAGTVSASGDVSGSHTYADQGTYTVTTTVTDADQTDNTGSATSSATVADAALTGGALAVNGGTEGTQATTASFSFTDANPGATAADYTATINWGDGTTTTATVSADGSGFLAAGSHTYAEQGTYTVSVTVNDDGGQTAGATAGATAADAALTASGTSANTQPAFSGTVATFTDANTGGSVADFTAKISWGDGTTSTGTVVSTGNGTYAVTGSHTYAATGPYTVTVHVADDGGSTADATTHLLVYAFATANGGSFVIGDGNAALGSQVTFWGAQWAAKNTLSKGAAPDSFKGFAATPAGTTYTTAPGNSSTPPATLPAYIGVYVSSGITKNGSTIAGDIVHIVIVRVDPGYAGNPGHAGTGTVVGQVG